MDAVKSRIESFMVVMVVSMVKMVWVIVEVGIWQAEKLLKEGGS